MISDKDKSTYRWRWGGGLGLVKGFDENSRLAFKMQMARDYAVTGHRVIYVTSQEDTRRLYGKVVQTWPELGRPKAAKIQFLSTDADMASIVDYIARRNEGEPLLLLFDVGFRQSSDERALNQLAGRLSIENISCVLSSHDPEGSDPYDFPLVDPRLRVAAATFSVKGPWAHITMHRYLTVGPASTEVRLRLPLDWYGKNLCGSPSPVYGDRS